MLTYKITASEDGYIGEVPEFATTIQGQAGPSRIRAAGLSRQSVWNQLDSQCRVYHGGKLEPLTDERVSNTDEKEIT